MANAISRRHSRLATAAIHLCAPLSQRACNLCDTCNPALHAWAPCVGVRQSCRSILHFRPCVTLQAIAAHSGRHAGIPVDWQSETLVTSGATEALAAAFLALLNAGDEVRGRGWSSADLRIAQSWSGWEQGRQLIHWCRVQHLQAHPPLTCFPPL